MKRFYALLLAAVTTLSVLATSSCTLIFGNDHLCEDCGKCTDSDCTLIGHSDKCTCAGSGELPFYEALPDGEGFYLSIFADPAQQTVEAYQDVVDLGCNWVYIDPWSGTNLDSPGLIKALECCEAVGLNALIMLSNAHGASDFISLVDDSTIDYTQYPAFKGCYAFDEPTVAEMAWIVQDYEKWMNSQYKDYIYFVNMMTKSDDEPDTEKFLQKYWDNILSKNQDNILIYDAYPLKASLGDKVEPYIGKGVLESIDKFAQFAKDKNSKFYVFIQTYSGKTGSPRYMESVNDARFQIGYNLAYGAQGYACFTYLTMSQFGDSMITGNGEKLPNYYYIQEVFAELKKFEDVYFAFDYEGTMALLGPNRGDERGYGEQSEDHITSITHALTEHERIKNVETEYDLLIGAFEDKDGNDGFLITSWTDPYYMKDNNISVEFKSATRALVYLNGSLLTNDAENTCYVLTDGTLSLDLEAGDWAFVIPVK